MKQGTLSKRANIMIDERRWAALARLAKKRNTSVAELIRDAVDTLYNVSNPKEEEQNTYEEIRKHRSVQKGSFDYHGLIHEEEHV